MTTVAEFSVWKTVTIGTGHTAEEFRREFKSRGKLMGYWEVQLLTSPNFTVSTEEIALDLVNVSAEDLGLPWDAKREEIYARALELGWTLCPAEVAPQLLIQGMERMFKGDHLFIGMEPIRQGINLCIFEIEWGERLNLCMIDSVDKKKLFPDDTEDNRGMVFRMRKRRWIFVRPMK